MNTSGKKVEFLLRSWGFGDSVVKQFEDEEIDEEAFECLDRQLIQQLFKTVGAQAKFLKYYNIYLKEKKEKNNGSTTDVPSPTSQPPPLHPLQQSAIQHSALQQSALQQSNLQHAVLQQPPLQHQPLQQSPLQPPPLLHHSLQQSALQQSTLQQSQLPVSRVKTETEVEGADGQIITIVGYESLASCSSWPPLQASQQANNERQERSSLPPMLCAEAFDVNDLQDNDVARSALRVRDIYKASVANRNFHKVVDNENISDKKRVFNELTETASQASVSPSTSPNKSTSQLAQTQQASPDSACKRNFPFQDEGSSSLSDETKRFCYTSLLENDESSNSGNETSAPNSYDTMPQGVEDWQQASAYAVSAIREQLLESCIPKTWSEDLQIAIEHDALSAIQQNEIIRRIADRMMAEGLKGDANFRDVAQLAISRIPCLGSRLTGSVGLVSRLKSCVKNKTHYAKRRAKKEGYTINKPDISHDDAVTMMRSLVDQSNAPISQLKALLQVCRKGRLSESRTHLPADILHRYPALRQPELALWEFEEIAHYKVDDLRARWLMSIPKIQKLLLLTEDEGCTAERATINILLKIEEYFPPRGKCKGPTRSILSLYPNDVNLADIIPAEDNPPCLVAVGDSHKDNLLVTVFVNTVAYFVGHAVDALLMLIALYWVFSTDFAPSNRLPMIFLNSVLMPTQMANEIVKYRKVLSALEEMEKLW